MLFLALLVLPGLRPYDLIFDGHLQYLDTCEKHGILAFIANSGWWHDVSRDTSFCRLSDVVDDVCHSCRADVLQEVYR